MNQFQCLTIVITLQLAIVAAGITRFPEGKPCTKAEDCGRHGCCLHGACSSTGHVESKCYISVHENGHTQFPGIWDKTDICPCDYTYYCYPDDKSGAHPVHGDIGECFAIIK